MPGRVCRVGLVRPVADRAAPGTRGEAGARAGRASTGRGGARGEETSEPKLFARTLPPPPPKEPYADIAALPRLAAWIARRVRSGRGIVRPRPGLDRRAALPGPARADRRRAHGHRLAHDAAAHTDHPPDLCPARRTDPARRAGRPRPRFALPSGLGLAGGRGLVLGLLVLPQRLGFRGRAPLAGARPCAGLPRLVGDADGARPAWSSSADSVAPCSASCTAACAVASPTARSCWSGPCSRSLSDRGWREVSATDGPAQGLSPA